MTISASYASSAEHMYSRPQLTIGVPAYNVASYLERGLATYNDPRFENLLEVIIVDDGSTDQTPLIAQTFVDKNPLIFRLIHKENGGHGSAVNTAMHEARGRYFRIVDGDDWVSTEALIKLVHQLNTISTDLVIDERCDVDIHTFSGVRHPLPPSLETQTPLAFDQIITTPDISSLITIHTLSVKTELLKKINLQLLEHTFYVDMQYVISICLAARDITFLHLDCYHYLIGNGAQSVADSNFVTHFGDHTRVTETLLALYKTHQGKGDLSSARFAYLEHSLVLLVHTHYKIALIFDKQRTQGWKYAHSFNKKLKEHYPAIEKLTHRYWLLASLLHFMGIKSQKQLNRLHKSSDS